MKVGYVVPGMLAALLGAFPAVAVAATPAEILGRIPAPVFDAAWVQNDRTYGGLDWPNRTQWHSVQYQRFAMESLIAAAVHGSDGQVAQYFAVIETGFDHQKPDGSFEDEQAATKPVVLPTAAAFFLGDVAEALLVLRSSSLGPRYAARIQAVLPRYRAGLRYLSQPQSIADMQATDRYATNRQLEDAKALLLGDQLVGGDAQAHAAGEAILDHALAEQSPAGYFPENGGSDTSYNGVSCMLVGELTVELSSPRLPAALDRCISWELGPVQPDGEVEATGNTRTGPGGERAPSGRPKGVNYREVCRAFAIAGALGNARAMDAATRIAGYMRAHNLITGEEPAK
jgi:hypothetical protein